MSRIRKLDPEETQARINAVVAAGVLGGLGVVLLAVLLVVVVIFR
jgi:hypothetical protein